MKKSLILFLAFFIGFNPSLQPVSPSAEIDRRIAIGAAIGAVIGVGLFGYGLWYYLSRKNAKIKKNILMSGGRIDFCRTVLGVSEKAIQKMSLKDRITVAKEAMVENGEVSFGRIDLYSIDELRKKTENRKPFKGEGSVSVIVDPTIDVKDLQADPQNAGANFQIASNFNGQEAGQFCGDDRSLNELQSIFAQGEQASMSAYPGIFFRKYFSGPINLLDELVAKGIVTMDKRGVLVRDITSLGELVENQGLIKVGYHSGISVTHGSNFANIIDRGQRINQTFTAALNLGANPRLKDFSSVFLRAAYEGTVRASFLHGVKKVFLTLVGGGVFCNDLEDIAKAIQGAAAFAREKSMDVVIVCRMDPRRLSDAQKHFLGRVLPLVKNATSSFKATY